VASHLLQNLAIIALGSNLGSSREIILQAMERLQSFSDAPLLRSSLWKSAPVDCPDGSPEFINAVVGLFPRNAETPETLLAKLQVMEKEFGRQTKRILNEPRSLDLDLIAFGEETRASSSLTLPHPRAHQRAFVLLPLQEIAPEVTLPGLNRTVSQLTAALTFSETNSARRAE
jgi:2-amino-4-hydroxy-6-hydroxymethyldihydropteridine diphosphokinase